MLATQPRQPVDTVRAWLGDLHPYTALVLGSGLGQLTDRMTSARQLPYSAIPGFPPTHVTGHAGALVAGHLAGKPVLCQSGRFHGYEGHTAEMVALPVRLFAALGVTRLIVTNAAGGIGRRLEPGSLMLIADQINLTGANPLFGAVRDGETRFPDMSAPYDPAWSGVARMAALELGIPLDEGTYAGLSGPSYETPAEVRMLQTLGADAVGMSTVLEVVAARALGMRCLGFSIIANRAAGLSPDRLSHADVLAAAARAGTSLGAVIERLLHIAE